MKKFWTVLLVLLLAAVLVFAGMGRLRSPKTPEKILAAAGKNMGDISSMRFEMNLKMELSVLQEAVSLHVSAGGEMTADPAVVHGTVKTEMSGAEPTETEVYLETEGEETVIHIGTGAGGAENWTTQREKTNSGTLSGTAGLLELINVFAETEPETVSETEMVFSGEIPPDQVRLAMQATGMLMQLQSAELLEVSVLEEVTENLVAMPVRIRVDTEKQIITGYELDMTGAMQAILTASVQKGLDEVGLNFSAQDVMEVTQVTADMHFSAFDEVEEIVIPEHGKN